MLYDDEGQPEPFAQCLEPAAERVRLFGRETRCLLVAQQQVGLAVTSVTGAYRLKLVRIWRVPAIEPYARPSDLAVSSLHTTCTCLPKASTSRSRGGTASAAKRFIHDQVSGEFKAPFAQFATATERGT